MEKDTPLLNRRILVPTYDLLVPWIRLDDAQVVECSVHGHEPVFEHGECEVNGHQYALLYCKEEHDDPEARYLARYSIPRLEY